MPYAIKPNLFIHLPPKNGCATSYGCAPGNMVAFVKYACQKNVCTTSYGSATGNMVASINLATTKKNVAQPPMVA